MQAAAELGVTKEVLNNCLRNERSDEYLLNNSDARREAGLSYCYLPEFALNNVRPCLILSFIIMLYVYSSLFQVKIPIFDNINE